MTGRDFYRSGERAWIFTRGAWRPWKPAGNRRERRTAAAVMLNDLARQDRERKAADRAKEALR